MKSLLPSIINKDPNNKKLLVHAHIFKNAGTTIDWILKRNFQSQFRDDRNDSLMLHDPEYFSNLVIKQPELRAISSHSFPLPYLTSGIKNLDIYIITFIRNPLLRIRSVYRFEKNQRSNTPGAIAAKKYTFKEYVSWRMEPSTPPTIRNMHVRYLTFNSQTRSENLSYEHLQDAISFVDRNPLFGVVEYFDQSLIVFEDALLPESFDLDFRYIKQNISEVNSFKSDEQKLDEIKIELGDQLYNKVLKSNALDCELYEYAKQKLKMRFREIPDNSIKLNKLINECAKLTD